MYSWIHIFPYTFSLYLVVDSEISKIQGYKREALTTITSIALISVVNYLHSFFIQGALGIIAVMNVLAWISREGLLRDRMLILYALSFDMQSREKLELETENGRGRTFCHVVESTYKIKSDIFSEIRVLKSTCIISFSYSTFEYPFSRFFKLR